MKTVISIFLVLFLVACQSDAPINTDQLSIKEQTIYDSLHAIRFRNIRQKTDSLCKVTKDSLFKIYVDSLYKQRLMEVNELIEK